MIERGTETGTGGSGDVGAHVAALLTEFEERCDRLEEGLSAQVDRVRGSAEAIDMLTDEVRRSLQRWQEDNTVAERLSRIERLLGEPRVTPEAPPIDLTPVTSALAEVLEAVALQSETAQTDRRALQDEVETLRSEVRTIPGPVDLAPLRERLDRVAATIESATPDPVDLGPIERRIADLAEAVTDRAPEPVDLSALHDHLDQLAQHVTASAPRPVDLAGVTSSIVGLHQRIDALTERPGVDLGPVEDRLASIDAQLAEKRPETVDLTPLTAAIADLRTHIADSRPDLTPLQERLDELTNTTGTGELRDRLDEVGRRIDGLDSRLDLAPIQHALAEVVDALAQQIDDSRSSSANALAAIEVLADRVRESRTDLQPVSERLAGLADSEQIDELGRRVDELAQTLAGQHPEPVDLTPLSAAIADLRTHIADSRPDLAPLQTRLDELLDASDAGAQDDRLGALARSLDELAADVRAGRVDLAPIHERLSIVADAGQVDDLRQRVDQVAALAGQQPESVDLEPLTSAIAELRTHIAESRPDLEALRASIDLGSIRSGIAEVVEASALQLETTERTAAELRAAIAATAEAGGIDLTPIVGAVDALRHHYDETQPDLEALVEAMKAIRTQIISGVHEAAEATRVDLQPLLDGIEAQRAAQESLLERVRSDLTQLETATLADGDQTRAALEQVAQAPPSPIDLAPVLEAVDAIRASMPRIDLQPLEARLESLAASIPTVDLEPVLQAVVELRDALPPTTDLTPVHQAIADLAAELPPATDLDPVRDDLATLRQTLGSEIDTVRDRLDAVRDSMPSVDLGPILTAVEALRQHMPTVDLDPVLRAVESVRGDLPTLDLEPVLRALESVRADLPTVELDPVLDAVETVRRELPEIDLARLHAQLADLASRIDAIDTSVDLDPVHRDIDSLRTAVGEAEIDLTPVLDGLSDLGRRVDDTAEIERLRAAIDRVADDVAGTRAESARAEMIDQLSQRLDSLQAAVESIRADDALRDTELRLSRRVDANSESLRAKIDDQRALADGLAANVSQLNAALTLASEQPQQLRRDLDRTLEQLAERLGGAMRDLRKELDAADEPLALRSSVEAGLDRITGRFQTDTSRILEAVAAAQEDADGRLRRIDNQMTELRRAVDRARRENERLEGAPST